MHAQGGNCLLLVACACQRTCPSIYPVHAYGTCSGSWSHTRNPMAIWLSLSFIYFRLVLVLGLCTREFAGAIPMRTAHCRGHTCMPTPERPLGHSGRPRRVGGACKQPHMHTGIIYRAWYCLAPAQYAHAQPQLRPAMRNFTQYHDAGALGHGRHFPA